jgi:hypothetical protein
VSGFNAADGPLHTHRDVPIRTVYGSTASYILAFSEGLGLAKSRRQRGLPMMAALNPKSVVKNFRLPRLNARLGRGP